MTDNSQSVLSDEQTFQKLLQSVAELQSSACTVGIERQNKQSCVYEQERDKSICDQHREESLKIIQQTSDVARHAMYLIIRALRICASFASTNSKSFSSLSSTVSYLRQQKGLYRPPKHLLVEWERSMILIDLFTGDEGLYCNKRIAQDMFDICMETIDWLRSLASNNE